MRAPRLFILAIIVVAGLTSASIAAATFTSSSATTSTAISAATLTPPAGLVASASCTKNDSVSVSLAWTASNLASGYAIYRATGAGSYSQIATVGGATTSYTDSSVTYSSTYSYYVVAAFYSWTAKSSGASATTASKLCK